MEIDVFPVVPDDYLLPWAFDLMTSWNRSALVVKDAQRYALVEAVDVVIAMSERTAGVLTPLMVRHPLVFVTLPPTALTGFDFSQPGSQAAVERAMDDAKASYALLAVSASRAVVASRHEDLMPTQAAPKDCYCRTDRKTVSPGTNGGNCPHDHRHIGTVRCR